MQNPLSSKFESFPTSLEYLYFTQDVHLSQFPDGETPIKPFSDQFISRLRARCTKLKEARILHRGECVWFSHTDELPGESFFSCLPQFLVLNPLRLCVVRRSKEMVPGAMQLLGACLASLFILFVSDIYASRFVSFSTVCADGAIASTFSTTICDQNTKRTWWVKKSSILHGRDTDRYLPR